MKRFIVAFAASFILGTTLLSATALAEPQIYVDGNRISSYVIKDGRTYVQLKDLSHYIGYSLEYNDIEDTVNFYKSGDKPIVKRESSLFPTQINEIVDGDRREIIKIYELSPSENPVEISKEAFEQDGYRYQLTDITKNDTSSVDAQEHVETVTVNTSTKDINAILEQLQKEIAYKTEDGYEGVLQLDITTIHSEVAGYKNSSYTSTETREYSNLSSADTSLVPKTITVNGKTLSLASVQWQSMNNTPVDYSPLPDTYKAIVKYTATGTKSTATGYVTTAEYKGNISRIISGKTIYTAYFLGTTLTPVIEEPVPTPEPTSAELAQQLKEQRAKEKAENSGNAISVDPLAIVIALLVLGLLSGAGYFFFFRKNVTVENSQDGKFKVIGKVKVTKKDGIIDLTPFTAKVAVSSFTLTIDRFTAKRLKDETLTINFGHLTGQHTITFEDGALDKKGYCFDFDF